MNQQCGAIKIWKLIGLLLLIIFMSCINNYITLLLYLYLIYKATKSPINAMKSIIIGFTIFFLNPGVVKIGSNIQLIRWILLFIGLYTISKSKNIYKRENLFFLLTMYIWALYNLLTSMFNSGDITLSLLKLISFSFSFFVIISYVNNTEYDWKLWLLGYDTALVIASVPMLFTPIGKMRNGVFFQGIWNHPNGFAVMISILSVMLIYMLNSNSYRKYKYIILSNLIVSFPMLIMTESRTGIICVLITSMVFIVIQIKEKLLGKMSFKYILSFICISLIVFIIAVASKSIIKDYLDKMIYKGAEGNILYSSQSILGDLWEDIERKPVFGNGFGVDSSTVSNEEGLKLTNPVEKRNLILAVLAESGIVGLLIFTVLILSLISFKNRKSLILKEDIILLSVLLVNMSEMMFFSANGIGIFLFLIIGIYKSEIRRSYIQ